jgi:hypothetical protein
MAEESPSGNTQLPPMLSNLQGNPEQIIQNIKSMASECSNGRCSKGGNGRGIRRRRTMQTQSVKHYPVAANYSNATKSYHHGEDTSATESYNYGEDNSNAKESYNYGEDNTNSTESYNYGENNSNSTESYNYKEDNSNDESYSDEWESEQWSQSELKSRIQNTYEFSRFQQKLTMMAQLRSVGINHMGNGWGERRRRRRRRRRRKRRRRRRNWWQNNQSENPFNTWGSRNRSSLWNRGIEGYMGGRVLQGSLWTPCDCSYYDWRCQMEAFWNLVWAIYRMHWDLTDYFGMDDGKIYTIRILWRLLGNCDYWLKRLIYRFLVPVIWGWP